MDRIFSIGERFLVVACLILLVFFYVYVYGFGKVRGPLANKEFYRRGEIDEEAIITKQALLGAQENLKSEVDSADTAP
jgi:hypothetical protein